MIQTYQINFQATKIKKSIYKYNYYNFNKKDFKARVR